MSLTLNEIAPHLDTVRATEAFVCTQVEPGHYTVTDAVGAPSPQDVYLADEPLAAAAVRDGIRRAASPDPRRVVRGYDARAAAIVALGRDSLVILGRRDGCLAGVSDNELTCAARAVLAAAA